jgi:hypothetical protein
MKRNISEWYKEWGEIKVQEQLYNRRPAYQNNEIVSLFAKRISERNDDIITIAKRYDVEESLIQFMLDKRYRYSYKMLKIASNYLDIPYEELTGILEDEEKVSLRANTSDDTGDLFGIMNYMFNEMIKHERLSCE